MSASSQSLKDGALFRLGLLNEDDLRRAQSCIDAASDIETVRVVFADQHGILRGKTIVIEALASIFRSGLNVPNTLLLKDTSHRTVFPVWEQGAAGFAVGAGDLLLVPDPATFRRLSWTDGSAWLFCTPMGVDGHALPFAPRQILKSAVNALQQRGRRLVVGLEVEFHIFEKTADALAHDDATMPPAPVATRNLSPGYQYLTDQAFGRVEPMLNDLRRHAQALGLPVRSMEIEMGPSQFEFVFEPAGPMEHADGMMMFRAMVKEVCNRQGLHASFMCKPALPNVAASGWHIHQSLVDLDGANLMIPEGTGALSSDASAWIAGLLTNAAASCLLTAPSVNGYKRFQPNQLAPDRIQWGLNNRGAMIRSLMAPNDSSSRIENRVPEPAANPYFVFASQIHAGTHGLDHGLIAPAPVDTPYSSDADRLPETLCEAIVAFENSAHMRAAFGDDFVDYFSTIKRAEWSRYHRTVSEWEQAEYFNLF